MPGFTMMFCRRKNRGRFIIRLIGQPFKGADLLTASLLTPPPVKDDISANETSGDDASHGPVENDLSAAPH